MLALDFSVTQEQEESRILGVWMELVTDGCVKKERSILGLISEISLSYRCEFMWSRPAVILRTI